MSEVKILRLTTGEDVIASTEKDIAGNYALEKAFVIIPRQSAPGKPVQLMMSFYMPYTEDQKLTIAQDKVMTIVKPKKEILKSYQQNTSSILQPNKELITETKVPTLDK